MLLDEIGSLLSLPLETSSNYGFDLIGELGVLLESCSDVGTDLCTADDFSDSLVVCDGKTYSSTSSKKSSPQSEVISLINIDSCSSAELSPLI